MSYKHRRKMVVMWNLVFILLWAFTFRTTCLSIPLEVEQPPTIISQTPSPVIAVPFENTIILECQASGNPQPKYRWTKDNQDLILPNIPTIRANHTSGILMFHQKHFLEFQGKYRCFAFNKHGTAMSEEIEMIAPTRPKPPVKKLDSVIVKEGEPIALSCDPPKVGVPHQMYWMNLDLQRIEQDERVTMGTDGSLYFSHALMSDSRKDYCCYVAFPAIRTIVQKNPIAVVVKSLKSSNDSNDNVESSLESPPSLLLPSGVQTTKMFRKGEDLQLECVPGGFPTPKITWMKMGGSLAERTSMSNFNKMLTITAVEEQDQGQYMCTAENSAGKEVHYINVIVEDPPSWVTEPPQNQVVVIGSDVSIKCLIDGKPTPDIFWRKNGELLKDQPQSNREMRDDTLVLYKSTPEDSGVYQCEASNSHGSILANIIIMVVNMAPLMLTTDSQEYPVIVGQDVVMNCRVFSSPPSDIAWSKRDTAIQGERFLVLENGQSLKILNTEKDDSGEYVCMASNTEGMSAITALLAVKDPTKIVNPPEDVQIISGTSAQLICQAEYDISLQDTFEVVWKKDEEEILLSSEKNSRYIIGRNSLKIMNVNLSDQGMYTCTAKTSLDEDNATMLLTVLEVPDAPSTLKISENGGSRNIILSWAPGDNHNSSITEFVVEYEESQWEPGRWKELQKVPGNQATAELTLYGHLNYQFRVYAVNAVGPGPPSEPSERHKTPPTAPDRNPENIKIQGHLPHQMDVSWDPLLPTESNGPGLEYKVSYRKLGLEDNWTEEFVGRPSFTVRNTSTFSPYEVKIQSRNSYGAGPEPKVVTGYSGEDVPTASPRDVAVEVINTTTLRVSWTPVPPATVRGHLGGYNVYLVRKKSFLAPDKILGEYQSMSFPGNESVAYVPGLEPFSEYELTVRVFNKKGKGPRSDSVTFYTPEGVPGFVPVLTTSNIKTDSILLVWAPPLEANGILSGYLLRYHHINETSLEVIDSIEMNITGADITQWEVLGLKEGGLYHFHLSACTRAGCGLPLIEEAQIPNAAVPTLLNISSYVSDTFAKISWTASEEQRDSQLYVAYMKNSDGNWLFSEAVNISQSFHLIDGLTPGSVYTVCLKAKKTLGNTCIFEDVIQTQGVKGQVNDSRSRGWLIGTMCFLAVLTVMAIIACFVKKSRGGKYAGTLPPQHQAMFAMQKVKEKEVYDDTESQRVSDAYGYSDSDEKPLKGIGLHPGDDAVEDNISRDSLVDYTDEEAEFNEDGSFIGEYIGYHYRQPREPSPVTA